MITGKNKQTILLKIVKDIKKINNEEHKVMTLLVTKNVIKNGMKRKVFMKLEKKTLE